MLPFWNWDNQDPSAMANVIPHYYRDPEKYPGLFHANRDAKHAPGKPPFTVDLIKSNVLAKRPAERGA